MGQSVVYEGTWEEVLSHSMEFSGRRVRVIVLGDTFQRVPDGTPNYDMLEALKALQETIWTDEETDTLEGFEEFRRSHPITFRLPEHFDELPSR